MCNYLQCGDDIADGHPERFEKGVFAGYDLSGAMRLFLTISIDEAIVSKNPLVRGLAVLDKRTGQQRLARFDAEKELPFIKQLIDLRKSIALRPEPE